MIFFDSLYVLIARFFLSLWNKYVNWWINVRYGITVLFILNLGAINIITRLKMSKLFFMVLVVLGYLFISYYRPALNDKEYVENFNLSSFWKKTCLIYIILSVVVFVSAFVFIVMA